MKKLNLKKFLPQAGVATVALAAALGLVACGGTPASTGSSNGSAPAESDSSYELVTDGTITFATSPDYPPFENLEDGKYVGLDMDLGRAIAEELGLDCEYTNIDFDGIIPAIVAGGQADAGLSGISITPEREEQVDFSEPYYVDNQAVAVMSDNTALTEDNATDALNQAGVKIAVQSGSTGEAFAGENFPNAELVSFANFTDCFAAVQAGQADAVCGNIAVVNQMVGGAYANEHVIYTSATGEEYAIAVSKDNPELLAAINDAIDKLKEDGTIDELVAANMG
ncbi:ABC transporter substrate-binding protein [Collinsella sp. An2]|uniref:ABC transporter substrate-binding protein n=1 Tax=Collinsella sp. An2 TaxID=1965585 RepID=UPI000B36C7FA|nr:ABC transporter substrate-binding protein [Collinsella sp. An2]OUP09203.1 ABC transporter substrate-binding protein [Collinsella sp. An2]